MVSLSDNYFTLTSTKDRAEWLTLYARRAVHSDAYWEHEEVKGLFDIDAELQRLDAELAELTKQANDLRGIMGQRTREAAVLYPDDPAFAHFLYWTFSGIHAADLPKEGKPITIPYTTACSVCGERVEHELTFRSHSGLKVVAAQSSYTNGFACRCDRERWAIANRNHEQQKAEAYQRSVELKSMPYAEYLQTPEWQEKRKKALKRAGFKCQLCGATGELHVHHRTYENKGDEDMADLIVLCRDHHEQFHGKQPAAGREGEEAGE